MTANQSRNPVDDLFAGLAGAAGAFARGVARLFLAVMIVLAAGLVAVAAAIAGLFLAAAALLMRYTGGRARPKPARAGSPEAMTLEARRTARGWTVE